MFVFSALSQDTIYFRNNTIQVGSVKEINPQEIKYNLLSNPSGPLYTTFKNDISKIKYKNGTLDVFTLKAADSSIIKSFKTPINYDSLPLIKNSVRIYLTDVFFNKISIGYERMLNKKYSVDFDFFYKFQGTREYYSENWKQALYHSSYGVEIKTGASRHFYFKEKRLSLGFALAYRQQELANTTLYSSNYDKTQESGEYYVSQSKKGVGSFVKFNYQFDRQKSGFEFFFISGIYGAFTKNKYYSYRGESNGNVFYTTDLNSIPKFTTNYMKDGFALLPYLNFGLSYNIQQPQKGWYKKLVHKRDSLRFKRKNIIFYNPIELADGAIGLSYVRVFYKPALSLFSSAALPLTNHTSEFSNGILTEKNYNYVLNNKVIDLSAGLNYNFIANQQSFPFIGVLLRGAQFNGNYYAHNFVLNKYYAYVNTGFVVRGEKGFSFLINLALGHYYNDYVKNNPIEYMNKDYVKQPKNTTINSFNFSFQFGYSF